MISNAVSVKCHANIQKVFELLTKDVDFSNTKTCALYTLGQPKYIKLFKEKYPWVDFTIIETDELKCLYCDLPYKVIYVNIKEGEYWPKDMQFDKIIMNPPYDRSLHLKILKEVIPKGEELVNLSPIRWIQDPLYSLKKNCNIYKYEEDILKKVSDIKIIDRNYASEIFNASIYSNLGIYYFGKEKGFDYFNFWKKLKKEEEVSVIEKILKFKKVLQNKVELNKKDGIRVLIAPIAGNRGNLPIYKDISYAIDGYKNGIHWSKCKNNGGYEKEEGSPIPYSIKFNSEKEAQNFYNSCKTKFYKFLCDSTTLDQNVSLIFLPYLGNETNPHTGLKGYESEWTDDDFYKFFNITEEEQKVIEDTMKKYV